MCEKTHKGTNWKARIIGRHSETGHIVHHGPQKFVFLPHAEYPHPTKSPTVWSHGSISLKSRLSSLNLGPGINEASGVQFFKYRSSQSEDLRTTERGYLLTSTKPMHSGTNIDNHYRNAHPKREERGNVQESLIHSSSEIR